MPELGLYTVVAELTRSYLCFCLEPKSSFHKHTIDSSHDAPFEKILTAYFLVILSYPSFSTTEPKPIH